MHFLAKIPDDVKEEVWEVITNDVLDYKSKYNAIKYKITDPDVLIDLCTFLKADEEKKTSGEEFLKLVSDSKRRVMRMVMAKGDDSLMQRLLASERDEVQNAYEMWKSGKKAAEPVEIDKNNARSINSTSSDSGFVDPISEIVDSVSEMNLAKESEDEEEEEIEDEEDTTAPEVASDFFDQFPDCLNILILGETGVGKSTFINGLINYLKYGSIGEALRNKVEILIKAYFTHTDADYNRMRVECEPTMEMERGGDQENEHTIEGQSSTQSPKSYVFSWGPKGSQKAIRIIDTPGVGDVRGVDQEKLNFSKILDFIADFSEIHAICILLKPNESKLTVTFRYCINELLMHLHKSASQNILFCFTNSRQTLYMPGDTLPTLDAHLNELATKRGIRIPLDSNTMFCFDNESFRFLCALREGATFDEKDIENFNGSWRKTVAETFRLFKRISELPVHNVNETLSVNNIRSVILALARPLAEIARNQMQNVKLIEEKVKEVEGYIKNGMDLDGRLYVDQVKMIPKEIDYPKTVCTAASCVDYMKISSNPNAVTETIYRTECHERCRVKGVQTNICPNPRLAKCSAFKKYGINKCRKCSCPWDTHMHVRYILKKIMEKTLDPTVQESIKNRDDQIQTARLFIEQETKRKNELQEEADMITQCCVEFAAFLRKNSILPYNDVYMEYVQHLIKEEKDKAAMGGSTSLLDQLQNYKDEYEQQMKILEGQGNNLRGEKTIRQIYNMVDDLNRMKISGSILAEVQKLEMLSVRDQQTTSVTPVDLNTGWLGKADRGDAKKMSKKERKMTKKAKKG